MKLASIPETTKSPIPEASAESKNKMIEPEENEKMETAVTTSPSILESTSLPPANHDVSIEKNIVEEPVLKKQKLENEETIIEPSADAIERLKEQEKLREEEENETLQKEEDVSKPILQENVVRQVEEDEDYDE